MGRDLKKAIREQKLELERLLAEKMLDRAPMDKVDVTSHLAQAIVGMRRSGKSVVCRTAMKNSGVMYGYVDFDENYPAAIAELEAAGIEQYVAEVNRQLKEYMGE